MGKFKVGETVRITKAVLMSEDALIGKTGEIIQIDDDGDYYLRGFKGCMTESQLELVKVSFTKADMQIGQPYKMRNEAMGHWDKEDSVDYDDNLKWGVSRNSDYDIVEVYPFSNTPIWKRPEPKYRVKTELTKEQAEKLGLEFCEEVTE